MDETTNIDQELIESLHGVFHAIPDAKWGEASLETDAADHFKPYVILQFTIGDQKLDILAKMRGDVFPRDAREMVWQFKHFQQKSTDSHRRFVPMVIAKVISEGARSYFRDERVAYHDLSGSFYSGMNDCFVLIDKPQPKRTKQKEVSVFRGARAKVLHALFSQPNDWVTGTEIANKAEVSPAITSQTFNELERREWLQVKGKGPAKRRRLFQQDDLLNAWHDSILTKSKTKRHRYYVPRMSPEEMAQKIKSNAHHAFSFEFTGQFAAQSYAPYLSTVSDLVVRIRHTHFHEQLLSILGARKVSQGANLTMIDADGKKLSCETFDNNESMLASPLQVYLDLLEDYGRSKEMAEHLRYQKLTLQ